jgi:TonB family protein
VTRHLYFIILLMAASCSEAPAPDERPLSQWVKMSGAAIAAGVVKGEMPAYPATALRERRGGVVVVSLQITERGFPDNVRVLEAAADDLGAAVTRTLGDWRFDPAFLPGNAAPVRVRGKLIFYFEPVGDRGTVFSPHYAGRGAGKSDMRTVSEAEAIKLRGAGAAHLIDVREAAVFARSHPSGAVNIPLRELAAKAHAAIPHGTTVLVYGGTAAAGGRRTLAARLLSTLGYDDIVVVGP